MFGVLFGDRCVDFKVLGVSYEIWGEKFREVFVYLEEILYKNFLFI